ncbi:YihY/virulence factor BrkB family protein [Microvirga sp. HBU67558]|uniref:YihY/virulence factor BrkB family protein n=2 Tax=Methylobacteriaceae TaxID=119045 RepID=UPI001B394722|nr:MULTISPECIES: YihY/virulence factor BrkB family protein [unclassified Microvirga]MBQ0819919.1 YihY/virulence factor BrkB family protein [Microvirga sp. HBU67558]
MRPIPLPSRARSIFAATADAGSRFARNDGLAMASHVALSLVIALFPFLICVAALAAFLGAGRISTHIVHLLFDFWPEGVAGPLAREADKVLIPRRNVLTISIVLTLLVATNGVESLRVALCRAYGVERFRPWWQARLIGIGFILIGAGALVASSVLVVLWPSIWRWALSYMPDLRGLGPTYDVVRYGLASFILVAGLAATHLWLPDTRPQSRDVVPGIAATLVLWLVGASLYGEFLATMTHLKATYAGLAGILTALIFLQISAAIFIFGAELNAALRRRRTCGEGARKPVSASQDGEPLSVASL